MNRIKSVGLYAMLLLGSATLAFGLYNVHAQSGITEGGVLGLTLFFKHWLDISPAVSGLIIDGLCFIFGFKVLGKTFIKYSIVASAGFAFFYSVFERFEPLLPSLENQPVLAAVLGGVFVGVGCGINVRIGGACGGDDALAMSISKLFSWKVSGAYLLTDITVLLLSLTYIPFQRIVYSLITVTVSSFLIGNIQKISLKKLFSKKAPKTKISHN